MGNSNIKSTQMTLARDGQHCYSRLLPEFGEVVIVMRDGIPQYIKTTSQEKVDLKEVMTDQ